MKLVSKTLVYYLLISLPLLLIAGALSYYLISAELSEGIEEALWKEKSHVEKMIPEAVDTHSPMISKLSHVSLAPPACTGFNYSNKIVYDSLDHEYIKYRVLNSYYKYKGKNYKIEITRPSLEDEELAEGLFSAFGIIAAFLLLSFFFVNWLLSKTVWKPFYKTLEQLKTYELKKQFAGFETSSTLEFSRLNDVLRSMTTKMHSDFLQQKEFTENAAHELQTPLAIIRANISLLIQSPNLSEQEMNLLETIDNTTKKLTAITKALLLLSKIENNQFKEKTIIDLPELIQKECEHLQDLFEAQQIVIENRVTSDLKISINSTLANILLTNLFQNAIRHNYNGGKVILEIIADTFVISNTGMPLQINNEELFTRFKKNEASKDSLGLGLAIVKSICHLYGIIITYEYRNELHRFALKFKPEDL